MNIKILLLYPHIPPHVFCPKKDAKEMARFTVADHEKTTVNFYMMTLCYLLSDQGEV